MATESEKNVQLISKLIELTQEGNLKWKNTSPRPSLKKESSDVDVYYRTEFKEKHLGLYQHKVEKTSIGFPVFPSQSYGTSGYSGLFGGGIPTTTIVMETVLEIIDLDGNCLYEFPKTSGLSDLYEAVRYQVADVKGFIDSMLE